MQTEAVALGPGKGGETILEDSLAHTGLPHHGSPPLSLSALNRHAHLESFGICPISLVGGRGRVAAAGNERECGGI